MEGKVAQKKRITKSHHNREYISTYAFNGYLRGEHAAAISLIRETVAQMQSEGTDIEFLGATLGINGAGQLIELTARYAARSKGTIGELNCRACLPATGAPQWDDTNEIEAMTVGYPWQIVTTDTREERS